MKRVLQVLVVVVTFLVVGFGVHHMFTSSSSEQAATKTQKQSTQTAAQKSKKKQPVINWRKPSEDKPYPKISKLSDPWIRVSIKNQRVYIKDGTKTVYTMFASTGVNDSTPKGTFHIQAERGDFFYNQQSGEGAKYWTSFKDHGIYLFHTVPTDQYGNYNKEEAAQLGKEAKSHGCVRLSVPDAKWFYTHIPEGMKVVVE
ncbi:L,D-transpeptidase [Secundilactobacillus muriivasis]